MVKKFKEGTLYVEGTIQVYQRNTRITPDTSFPLHLEIDEIAVTIVERSEKY